MGKVHHLYPKTIKPALTREQFLAMFTNPTLREQIYRHFDEKYEEQEDDKLYKFFRSSLHEDEDRD